MRLENGIETEIPKVPDELKDKIFINTVRELSYTDYTLFELSMKAIVYQMIKENTDFSKLNRINVIFTNDGSFSMNTKDKPLFSFTDTCGYYFKLAVYPLEVLHKKGKNSITLFAFTEELVHHFWNIEDESLVKYKVLDVLNYKVLKELDPDILNILELIDSKALNITEGLLNEWGVNWS